jgi:CRP-like cAMP-binding protein
MISPELLRRYPFFSCLSHDQITTLAMAGEELTVEAGHYFFHEGDKLRNLFFVIEGEIEIGVRMPDRSVEQDVREQIMGNFIEKYVSVSSITPGQIFAWSAMIPPNESTASAKAVVPCRVAVFDGEELMQAFQDDCPFGYLMLQKIAVVVRQRLRDMRIQSLAFVTA